MKIIRYAAFVLGGVAALLAALAVFVSLSFDASRVKSEAAAAVKEKFQRELAIEGEPQLTFWPALGVTLGRTTLSERGASREFASLDGVRVSLELLPLLRRRIVVGTLDIRGLRATLVRAKNGALNIDDLLGGPEAGHAGAGLAFDVAGVRLVDASLELVDEQAGRRFALTGVNLDAGRLASAARDHLALALRVRADTPRLDLALALEGDYDYDMAAKRYAVSALKLDADGDAAALTALDVGLAASLLRLDAASGALAVEQLSLSAKAKQGAENLIVTWQAPRLEVQGDQAAGESAEGRVTLTGGPREVNARFSLSALTGNAGALAAGELRMDLDARQGESALKGTLASPLAAGIAARTLELPGVAGSLTLTHPRLPMKSLTLPFDASLRADFAKSSATGTLSARLEDSRAQGRFSLARFSPPALGFELDVDTLDLDRYLPPPARAAAPGGEAEVDFSFIDQLDMNGKLRVGALRAAGVRLENLRMDVRARNGRLDVSPFSASLYEGRLDGSLSLIAAGRQLRLKQNLVGVQINPLMRDALNKDVIEGRGNIVLDLATAGATPSAMKKALSGSGRLRLRDGAIKGIDLARSLRELKGRVGGVDVQAASAAEKTDFTELSASARIAAGVARNDDLAARSPFLRLAGAGDIDIGEARLDYLARASVVGTPAGQDARDFAHLKGITVPVRLTGAFDALSYSIEFGSLASDFAKAKAREAVDKTRQDVQNKARDALLKDGLKGLLR